jgi:DoxX-like family
MSTSSAHGPFPVESTAEQRTGTSKGQLWTGRVFTVLSILFLLFDAVGKFAKPAQVVDAFARLGIPITLSTSIGTLLLVCTVLYAFPRTAVLGAVLLTGYFGGAVAIHMRAGSSAFETVFPVIFGVLSWAGIYLRSCSLRKIFPVFR